MCDSNKQGPSSFLAQMHCEVLNRPQTPIEKCPKRIKEVYHPESVLGTCLFVHSRFQQLIQVNLVARTASIPLELLGVQLPL